MPEQPSPERSQSSPPPQRVSVSLFEGEHDWLLTGFLAWFLLFAAVVTIFILIAA